MQRSIRDKMLQLSNACDEMDNATHGCSHSVADNKGPSSSELVNEEHACKFSCQRNDTVETLEEQSSFRREADTGKDLGTVVLCESP